MVATDSPVDFELALWERLFVPDPARITDEQANYLLGVRFPQADLDRVSELSAKARAGTLDERETAELDRYIRLNNLVAILKAKMRGKLAGTKRKK